MDRHLKPVYELRADRTMIFYAGELLLTDSEGTFRTEGQLRMQFVPRPRLLARVKTDGRDPLRFAFREEFPSVSVVDGGHLHPPSVDLPDLVLDSGPEFPVTSVVAGSIRDVKTIQFHVIGRAFEDFAFLPLRETAEGYQQQLEFELPQWQLRLAVVKDVIYGEGFSYVIEASPLGSTEVDDFSVNFLQETLVSVFQLVAGQDIGLFPVVGLGKESQVVWANWATPRYGEVNPSWRWCAREVVADAFPVLVDGLFGMRDEQSMVKVVRRAIGYLSTANNSRLTLDVRIPLACSGLELLAWAILQQEGWLTADPLGRITAASRTRLLLQWCGIPVEIPDHFTDLYGRRKRLNLAGDGPEVIFDVRNGVVHPPKKLADPEWPQSGELMQSWQLSSWYLELAILRVLNYTDKYRSRLELNGWSGDLEKVPWS